MLSSNCVELESAVGTRMSSQDIYFYFFFQMWIFRKVQNPTFTFFRRHVLQVLAKMLFLAKQPGMEP